MKRLPVKNFQLFTSLILLGTIGNGANQAVRVRKLTKSSHSKFKMVWHQLSTVQFHSHQFVWKVRSVKFGVRGSSAFVQFVQFISRTIQDLARSDLTRLVRLGLDSVHRVRIVLEEQSLVPSSGNPSPWLLPGWRDDVLCCLCLLDCPGCDVMSD